MKARIELLHIKKLLHRLELSDSKDVSERDKAIKAINTIYTNMRDRKIAELKDTASC